ncbi:hypothetical protein DPMN_028856 [Dreissena polymorpha]|uniref:Tesmin/TSO1-like CXC domain-containing protein n=1 Tax=Dreissena polymorpha TaxID=45954 RepID=A0A9D4LY29_DREPO|nr:hypothetical protein DPMN_028856 [Dreissena polymorpha]
MALTVYRYIPFHQHPLQQSSTLFALIFRLENGLRLPIWIQLCWRLDNGLYVPIKTDMSLAPADLLAIVMCKCILNCDTRRCPCRKHGLECSVACKECKGSICSNCPPSDFTSDDYVLTIRLGARFI